MIVEGTGKMLDATADALVVAVNTRGTMGAGQALAVRQRYPHVLTPYKRACYTGELRPGQVLVVPARPPHKPGSPLSVGALSPIQWLILFPTKTNWQHPSEYEYVAAGLDDLVRSLRDSELGIRSLIMPALGCSNGGLDYKRVRPMIESALAHFKGTIYLYAPGAGR